MPLVVSLPLRAICIFGEPVTADIPLQLEMRSNLSLLVIVSKYYSLFVRYTEGYSIMNTNSTNFSSVKLYTWLSVRILFIFFYLDRRIMSR